MAPILSEQETRELAAAQPMSAFAYVMQGGSGAADANRAPAWRSERYADGNRRRRVEQPGLTEQLTIDARHETPLSRRANSLGRGALLWGFPYVASGWVGAPYRAPAPSQSGWVGA
jgi:hypothetical protein